MAANSQRIDVIVQTQRIIEMFSRAQGASVKEVCNELQINERTFYRRLDDLEKMDIPITNKLDPNANTSGKRWYLVDGYKNEVKLFLTPAEKMLLRQMVFKAVPGNAIEKSLSEKINQAILHDANSVNFASVEDDMEKQEVVASEDNYSKIAKAIELKKRISFGGSTEYTKGLPKIKDLYFQDCRFEPYTFVTRSYKNYVIGKLISKEHGDFIVGVYFNDIGSVTVYEKETFIVPEDYNADDYIKKWFYDKKPTHIKLSIRHEVADMISYCKWFDNIRVYMYYDYQEVQFDTQQLDEAVNLILSLKSDVKVLEPRSLQKRIKRELNKTCARYENKKLYPCAYKHRVHIGKDMQNFEDASFISLGKHTTNYALYKYYSKWWRVILHSEDKNGLELLRINNDESGIPVQPATLWYPKTRIPASTHRMLPQSVVLYKDRVLLEYPMVRGIKGPMHSLKESWENGDLGNNWWDDNDKCFMRYLFRRIVKLPEDERWEPYKKNPPKLLLTGVDEIDPKIAKELNENGTICGYIPAVAILYVRTPHPDGTDTVTCHVYGKDL